MYGPYFTIDKMKKWVDPKRDDQELQQQQIETVFLSYMVQLMPEYLSADAAMSIHLIVPEDKMQERKGCAWFMGPEEMDVSQLFTGIPFCQLPDVAQLSENEVQ